MAKVMILFAHPALQKSRVNAALIQAARQIPEVTIHDLYETYPDMHIDVEQEKSLLTAHDTIIFQHPFYWYSSPALLKEWQDVVLEYGWAYGRNGKALVGKKLLSVITCGGDQHAYKKGGTNNYCVRTFLKPFEQTATLCGMSYLPPLVLYDALSFDATTCATWSKQYQDLLQRLLDGQPFEDTDFLNDCLDQSAREL